MLHYPISLHLCRWMLPIKSISVLENHDGCSNSSMKGLILVLVSKVWLLICVLIRPVSVLGPKWSCKFHYGSFGSKYSKHGSKVKNASGAQDAHEAIRPSSVFNTPESIAKYLDKDQLKLYTLIWNRFVAIRWQLLSLILWLLNCRKWSSICCNGSQVKFDGYLAIYNDSDKNKMLPDMAVGDVVKQVNSKPEQHFTQPPARYSEATLIKTLEENGLAVRQPTHQQLKPFRNVIMFALQPNALNRQSWRNC